MGKKHTHASYQWQVFDCHVHTPASSDFQQPDVTMLDVLQRADARGVNILAITDHNTVAGCRKMQEEIQQLEFLEKLNRLLPEERQRLAEYRRLVTKILVLPGFEFSATFGFHILAIFPPEKPYRELEHILLDLNIPTNQLDEGSATVGATTDVLTAYQVINQNGGLVIAAHANSSNGVAMRGFNFGGQTKIAYTQDANLHALEVTDLESKGSRSTAAFFNGAKPEYPRRMHCIQGSDSHRLTTDPARKKNIGLGERTTEVLLPELSFDALKELFLGNDFSRTRPHRVQEEPAYDFIQTALEEGANIVQEFHESMTVRGGKLYAIIADICAFANTNGGTLYVGLSPDPKKAPVGVSDPEPVSNLEKEITARISPPLPAAIDLQEYKNKKLLRVLVPRGDDPPYAVDENKIYIRNEAETGLAVRDEIVALVLRSSKVNAAAALPGGAPARPASASQPGGVQPGTAQPGAVQPGPVQPGAGQPGAAAQTAGDSQPEAAQASSAPDPLAPRTGVEVLPGAERGGSASYRMRDLRNGNIVSNVTRSSARRLWHYAITRYIELQGSIEQANIQWQGDYGLIESYKQGKSSHFDMILKTATGYRYYFGVTKDGVHGPWKGLVGIEEA